VANQYEIEIATSIDSGGVSAFIEQVTAGLAEIQDRAEKAQTEGASTAGLSKGFQRTRSRAEETLRGSGLNERETQRALATLNGAFNRSAENLTRTVKTFRDPSVSPERRSELRTQDRAAQRLLFAQQQRTGLEGGSSSRARDRAAGYEDVNEEGILPVEAATRAKRNSAKYNNIAATDPDYREAALNEATALRRNNTGYNNSLAESPEYKTAYTDDETSKKTRQAAEDSALTTRKYVQASAEAAGAMLALKSALMAAETGSAAFIEGETAVATELKARQARLAEEKAGDDDYLKSVKGAAEGMAALKAAEAEAIAATESYADDARAKVANTRNTRNATEETLGSYNQSDFDQQGRISAEQARQKLAVATAELANRTDDDIDAEATLIVAKQEYKDALKEAVERLKGETNAGGNGPNKKDAGLFQRWQAHNDPDPNADPSTKRTLGQFIGSHAANTLGYAVPGLAFGVGIEELSKSVQEAEAAQKVFAELDAQFAALGQNSQLSGFTTSIKDISSNTGLAVSEVAELGMAMKGVYGDTQQATIALQGVSEGAVAMGLNIQDAQQDFTAITQSFSEFSDKGGAAITSVSNEILHLQDLTGVDGKNILEGTADAASSLNQLGIGFKPTASLVAAASERSGLPTETIGQTLAKLADGITQNYGAIADVVGDGRNGSSRLSALNRANPTQELTDILKDFKGLAPGQQLDIESSLGVNASARPALNALVEAATKGTELSKTTAPADRTQQEFKKQMDTLQGSFDRLRQSVVNFGVELIDGPFGKAVVEFADLLTNMFSDLRNLGTATGGVSTALAELVAVTIAARLVMKGISALSNVPNVIRSLGVSTETTVAEMDAADVQMGAGGIARDEGALSGLRGGAPRIAESGVEGETVGLGLASEAGGGAAAVDGGLLGAFGADSFLGAAASFGGPELLAIGATGYAGYKLGGLLNKHLGISKKITDMFEPATYGHESWQDPVKIGSNPYITGTGGIVGERLTKQAEAQRQPFIDTIESEIKSMSLHATAEQKYAIKLDEMFTAAGSENAFHNLTEIFTGFAHTTAGRSELDADKDQTESTAAAADPAAAHVRAHNQDLSAIKQAITARADSTQSAAEEAKGQLFDYQGISTAYAAGQVAFSTLLASTKATAQQAQATFNNPRNHTQANYQALQTALQSEATLLDQQVTQQVQFANSLSQTGSVSGDTANIGRLVASASKLKTPAALQTTAQGIVTAMQTRVQDEAANAQSLSRAQDILDKGMTATAAELAVINKSRASQGLGALSSLTVKGQASSISTRLSALSQQTQAVQAIGVAAANQDPVLIAAANYRAAEANMANDLAAGYTKGSAQYRTDAATAQESAQTLRDNQNAVIEAGDTLAAAKVALDPVAAANAAITLAQQQVADAHGLAAQRTAEASLAAAYNQKIQAIAAVKEGADSLTEAIDTANGDQIGAAKAQQALAEQELVDAHGIAAQEAAQANVAAANRNTYDTYTALYQARLGVAAALAGANGDPVQQAYLEYQADLEKLARDEQYDQAHGVNPQDDSQVLGDIKAAYQGKASWIQEQISQLESIGEMKVYLGQETNSQLIAQMEAELTKVKGNKTLTEQLLDEIRQVQDSAGGNLDFDVPANLLISPTLYQAERTQQNPGSYQDNRQVSVTINVNGKNTSDAVNTLMKAIGGSSSPTGGTNSNLMPTPVLASR
jgi:hypothetical protein